MVWVEKEIATHSSILVWRIPGTEEPGGLPSMGLHRVGHDWSDLIAAAAAAAAVVWDATFIICSISISCEVYFKPFSSVLLVCIFMHQCVLYFNFGGFVVSGRARFPSRTLFFHTGFPNFYCVSVFFHLNYSINLFSFREKCDFYCDHILLFSRSVVSNSLQPHGL